MDYQDANPYLLQLLQQHGIDGSINQDWIVTGAQQPPIRATWYPYPQNGCLDVEVFLGDGTKLVETVAGFGTGDAALQDALENFCINVWHVLLAAFWQQIDPEQVTLETWQVQQRTYTAYIGNLGHRSTIKPDPVLPEAFFDAFKQRICQETDLDQYAWFRWFFADYRGDFTFEALKNNDIWPEGIAALQQLPWQASSGYYSVRNLIVLQQQNS